MFVFRTAHPPRSLDYARDDRASGYPSFMRPRLRSRVLWLTSAFAIVLFAVTYGLSWRAHRSQERWSRLIRVETEATATLEELVRAQNAYRVRFVPDEPGAV